MPVIDHGGKGYAKEAILMWLRSTSGSNLHLVAQATGLPEKISDYLLGELIGEGKVELDKAVFKLR